MSTRYESYCLADPFFYDAPTCVRGGEFAIASRPTPAGWERSEIADCVVYRPTGVRLPPQGWKIHSSGTLDDADEILAAIWDYCVPQRIAFKFVRDERLLLLRNAKSADRGSSGKLATIYPVDDAQLAVVLRELGAALNGRPGPYILSDLRWGRGPLYVRYGGFASRFCRGTDGASQPAIEDDAGRLVPDRRGPTFEVPPWVRVPECLASDLDARNGATVADLPYEIQSALHFSNGGGVYRAVDRRSGEQVVLKEARPHAGLSADRADAVTRLGRERAILERLAGLDAVPAVLDHFVHGEHHFLVQAFIEGVTLDRALVQRFPLTSPRARDDFAIADHAEWAVDVVTRVERAVATVHERGVVLGDLHPSNLLVRPDGRIVIVDWELAVPIADAGRQHLGSPAFAAPAERRGVDVDRWALACLRLYLFLPLTALLRLDAGKAEDLAAAIVELFPVSRAFLDEAVRVIRGTGAPPTSGDRATTRDSFDPTDPSSWERARDSMTAAIVASATPARDDRLFPGDVAQFAPGGGINLAHGAAGVLYALDASGAGRFPEHEAWLVAHAMSADATTPLGFYDGLHGVAYALDRLGRRRDALNVLDMCVPRFDRGAARESLGVFDGLSGIGLDLAYFAAVTGDDSLREASRRVAEEVASRLGREDDDTDVGRPGHAPAGLMHGSSGPALLFLALYEETGDVALLDLAAIALRRDLRRCVAVANDGGLHVDEGWRTMPYLADGSAGIAMVLERYLAHRSDERFSDARRAIRRAAEAAFYMQSGLFAGRAGMIFLLTQAHAPGAAANDPVVAAQVRRLAWHAVRYRGRLVFPGDQLLRLSMDLATGTAGVMLAMAAALGRRGAGLPFLAAPAYKRDSAAD